MGWKARSSSRRRALEPLRVTLCDAFYGNLAQLMLHFFQKAQRPQVEAFFDLELLQQSAPEEEEPPVVPPPTPPTPPTP